MKPSSYQQRNVMKFLRIVRQKTSVQERLNLFVPILSTPSLHGIPFISDISFCFVAFRKRLFVFQHMLIYSRILFLKRSFCFFRCSCNRLIKLQWKMPWNIYQPQICPIIPIPLDVPASQNRSFLFCQKELDISVKRVSVNLAQLCNLSFGNICFKKFFD